MVVDLLNEVSHYLEFFIWRLFGKMIDSGPRGNPFYDFLVIHLCIGVAVSVFVLICRKIKQLLV